MIKCLPYYFSLGLLLTLALGPGLLATISSKSSVVVWILSNRVVLHRLVSVERSHVCRSSCAFVSVL